MVEWGRNCYTSGWRLFQDDTNHVLRGRYFYADDDAKHFDGFHHLDSRNWHDANYEIIQYLGEDLTTQQEWNAGQRPAAPPLQIAVGDSQCFSNGELTRNRIPVTDLIDGFPDLCFGPEERLPIWREISSYARCVTQRVWAFVICELYEDNFPGIQGIFDDWIGNTAALTHHQATSIYPAMVTAVSNDWSAIALDGTRNLQEIALQGLYSLKGPQDFGIFSSLKLWYDASTRAIEALTNDGYTFEKPLFLAGHSYGAAVALLVAARVRAASPNTFVRYLTFGCPKPGDSRLIDILRTCHGYSIRNTGDIVTVVPFTELQFWNFVPFYGAAALYGLATWEQPPEGYLQHDDGSLEARGQINPATDVITRILADAFNDVNIAPIQSHRLPEYQRRLGLRCNEPNWPVNDEVLEDCEGCTPTPYGWLVLGGKVPTPNRGSLVMGQRFGYNNACSRAFIFGFAEEIILDGSFPSARWWKIFVPSGTLLHIKITSKPGILIDGILEVGPDCNHLTSVWNFDLFDEEACFDRVTATDVFWWLRVINYDDGVKFIVDFGSCHAGGAIVLGGQAPDLQPADGSLLLGGAVPAITSGAILLGGRIDEMIYTILIEHRLNNNTNGGSAVTNTWNMRPLNSLTVDTGSHCSLSSNQFTLDAGKYVVRIWSVGNHIEFHKIRLLNVTDTTIDGIGSSNYVFGAQDVSELFTYLDIPSSKTYQVEHWSQTGQVTYGLGQPVNNGTDEVYCQVLIQKVG